jgi:hypothetical protein
VTVSREEKKDGAEGLEGTVTESFFCAKTKSEENKKNINPKNLFISLRTVKLSQADYFLIVPYFALAGQ